MRIDKLLWFLRLAASRGFAQQWVLAGHIRLNGRRIEKPGATVRVGDVLTLPMRRGVKVIEVLALPSRRGPASEAQTCYLTLDEPAPNPIADEAESQFSGDTLP
ncbi:MAG: RNA-binding S4 domain-containing protein [Sphingomonadaceae bacterium]